jgi:H+/Na+-translocating ferredoxin:NAD+ oxidoreductase subunit B
MDINSILIAMASMGGLGVFFAAGLSVANKKLHVEEDPRIAQVLDVLPGANCGGCGLPGCGKFAESVVNSEIEINGCPVNSTEGVEALAQIMGVEASQSEPLIARIFCQGGNYETAKKGEYHGIQSCIGATFAGGGEKMCSYGCMGFSDCVNACPFGAMYKDDNGLPVVIEEKCTGCGNCVDACPRDLIELHPQSHRLFVLCKNHDSPKESRKICLKACIGCGICARKAGEENIRMENNLAIVNYEVFGSVTELPTDKCSTNGLILLGESKKEIADA